MADQDEIDDWLDSDSDDDAGGDAGVALGTPNDSFVAVNRLSALGCIPIRSEEVDFVQTIQQRISGLRK